MTQPFALRPAQIPMVEWIRSHPRCAIFGSMGIGKTSGVLYALLAMSVLGMIDEGPILVIAPMRVAQDVWPAEVAKWPEFAALSIEYLTEPHDGLDKRIYTTHHQWLPKLVKFYGATWPFRTVVADESDKLKSYRTRQGGRRANALGMVAHTLVTRWINLTGTPAPNGLTDLWGQLWFLDRGARLGNSYEAFKRRWFHRAWNGYGVEPNPYSDIQIHATIRDLCLTLDAKDYYTLDEPVVNKVVVKLPPYARRVYKDLEKHMFAELLLADVKALSAATLTQKCLQLANGAVYTVYPEWESVHDEKIEALKSIQAETGGTPLLVAYQWRSDRNRLLKAFPQAVDISEPEGMRRFREGSAPIGIAHPKSIGHGIDGLQLVTNILVRFGHDWNLGDRLQMLERIGPMRQHGSGLNRPVLVYDIVAEGTVDEDVLTRHETKRTVQEILLEAMKRRG